MRHLTRFIAMGDDGVTSVHDEECFIPNLSVRQNVNLFGDLFTIISIDTIFTADDYIMQQIFLIRPKQG